MFYYVLSTGILKKPSQVLEIEKKKFKNLFLILEFDKKFKCFLRRKTIVKNLGVNNKKIENRKLKENCYQTRPW